MTTALCPSISRQISAAVAGPQSANPFTLPADDRVRLHNDQSGAPISPRVGEQDPEESISVAEWGTLGGTSEHRKLLTERKVLKRNGPVSTAEQRE